MSIFKEKTQTPDIPPLYKTKVAWTSRYQEAIEPLLDLNRAYMVPPEKAYDKFIGIAQHKYKITNHIAQIVPEPTNPVDPGALAVTVYGNQIGYVYQFDQDIVLQMLRAGARVMVTLSGGPYRVIQPNRHDCLMGESNFFAELTLLISPTA